MTPLEIALFLFLMISNAFWIYLIRAIYRDSLRLNWLGTTLRAFVSHNAGAVIWTEVDEDGNETRRHEPFEDGEWKAAIDRAMDR